MENITIDFFTLKFLIKIIVALGIMIIARMLIKTTTPIINNYCTKNKLDQHTSIMLTRIMSSLINIFLELSLFKI